MEPAIKHNIKLLYFTYIIGIILFIFTAIVLIYYSLGYRIDGEKYQIIQTGILRLSPIQENYKIFIDDKPVSAEKIKRSTEITNLLPKNHQIKIRSDHYQDWYKNITISPEKISNESDILLIPETPKISDLYVFDKYRYHEDNNQLAYSSGNLNIVNLNNFFTISYPEIDITLNTELKWLDSELLAIIKTNPDESNLTILNITNKNTTRLVIPYPIVPADLIGIHPTQSNRLIVYHQNDLIAYDLTNSNPEIALFDDVFYPQISQSHLYYYQNNELFVYNFLLNTTQKFSVGEINNFFLTSFPQYIILSGKHDNQLFNLNQPGIVFSFTGNIESITTNRELNLMAKTNNEIIIIDFTSQPVSYQTILRITDKINQAIWLNNHNIAYTSGFNLNRIDINGDNNQLIFTGSQSYLDILGNSDKINTVQSSNGQLLLQTINLSVAQE